MTLSNNKKTAIFFTLFLLTILLSLFAYSQQKFLQIFRNGEVIQEYAISEIDYIEVNEVDVPSPTYMLAHHSDFPYIDLYWEKVDGISYNLYRSTDDKNYQLIAVGLTNTNYRDYDDLSLDTYYYRVKGVKGEMESISYAADNIFFNTPALYFRYTSNSENIGQLLYHGNGLYSFSFNSYLPENREFVISDKNCNLSVGSIDGKPLELEKNLNIEVSNISSPMKVVSSCTGKLWLKLKVAGGERDVMILSDDPDFRPYWERPEKDQIGIEKRPYSVTEFLHEDQHFANQEDIWLQGYIIGCVSGSQLSRDLNLSLPAKSGKNIVLADTPDETSPENMFFVKLEEGIQNQLNLVDHPENYHKSLKICGVRDREQINEFSNVLAYDWFYNTNLSTQDILNNNLKSIIFVIADNRIVAEVDQKNIPYIDARANGKNINFWIWENTYRRNEEGVNEKFEGYDGGNGYYSLSVLNQGWSGGGLSVSEEEGIDLSSITDSTRFRMAYRTFNSYNPHMFHLLYGHDYGAVKGDNGKPAQFSVGRNYFDRDDSYPSIGVISNSKDWHVIDISIADLKRIDPSFRLGRMTKWTGNLLSVLSGGNPEDTIEIDSCFFYNLSDESESTPELYVFSGNVTQEELVDHWKMESLGDGVYRYSCTDQRYITEECFFAITNIKGSDMTNIAFSSKGTSYLPLDTEVEEFDILSYQGDESLNGNILEKEFKGDIWFQFNRDGSGKHYMFLSSSPESVPSWAPVEEDKDIQLYITGAGEFENGEWNPWTPDQFRFENGQYVYEVKNLSQFRISSAMGDWDSFNSAQLGCDYGEINGVARPLDASIEYNIKCPWKGDYKIIVSADLSTITLYTSTPKPKNSPLYIVGDGEFENGSWNAISPGQFRFENGQYEYEVNNLSQFRISTAMGDWDSFNSAQLGCDYGEINGVARPLDASIEYNIKCPWRGDYKIVVSGDLSTITLYTSTPKPVGNPPLYLRGDMNCWAADENWQLEDLGNGIYRFICSQSQSISLGESFKIAVEDWNKVNIGSDGTPLSLNSEILVYNGDNQANMTLDEYFSGVLWLKLGSSESDNYIALSNDTDYIPTWAQPKE